VVEPDKDEGLGAVVKVKANAARLWAVVGNGDLANGLMSVPEYEVEVGFFLTWALTVGHMVFGWLGCWSW